MKLSLKIREEQQQQQHKTPLLKAKLPISVAGLPFLSGIIAGDPSDLSFNLSTNFSTGPSLKLSYTPTTTTATTASAVAAPFSLSLKSGIGQFGSPRDSPLVISAHFNLFSTNSTSPNFSLMIKPQFGQFSLHKTTFSNPNPNPKLNLDSNPNPNGGFRSGFVPERSMGWTNITLESCGEKTGVTNSSFEENGGIRSGLGPERPLFWKDLTMESCNGKDGIFSGVKVRARTDLPVTSRFVANFRWGLNFPTEIGRKLPFLTVDKIGIERVEEVKKNKKGSESEVGDVELLKGMCNWMRNDLEVLQKENWELKQSLEKLKLGVPARNYGGGANGKVNNNGLSPTVENSSNFERWRSKKSGGEDNGWKELRKSADHASDVESELQKAIKAASS